MGKSPNGNNPVWAHFPPTMRSVITLLLWHAVASFAQTTNLSLIPEADAFVREADPSFNYGRAGSLSVAGRSATNGFGLLSGRTDSLVRLQLSEAVTALDEAFGDDWFIAR